MIRYDLKCSNDHAFESWFQSAAAYDALRASGRVTCPHCGSNEIEKSLMAPSVRPGRSKRPGISEKGQELAAREDDNTSAIAELKRKIEAESDYVGLNFASEARAMHAGDIPHRSIYGEAKSEEARSLLEDGVPVAPLPFIPRIKTN